MTKVLKRARKTNKTRKEVRKAILKGWFSINTRTRTKAEIDKYRIKSYKYLDLD